MTVLDKLATSLGRRDEVPNQDLAEAIVRTGDKQAVAELIEHLGDKNKNIHSDCIKVLYEIGYLEPTLIADWVGDFIKLLGSKNNRLVWGSMIALSTVAETKAAELFEYRGVIQEAMERGSVITMDNGIKTLALIAACNGPRRKTSFPYLVRHLETCRSKEIPQHAEKTLVAVSADNCSNFIRVLEKRIPAMTPAQVRRVRRIIKEAQRRS